MKKNHVFLSFSLPIIVLGLIVTVLTGCAAPGSKATKAPEKLTVMMFDYGNTPAGESLTDNIFTQYVNKCMFQYGIEVEYNAVPWVDEEEYVKKLMASGNASDIMLCSDRTMVQNYYPEGYSHNLTDFISSELTPDLIRFIGEDSYAETCYESGEHWSIRATRAPMATNSIFIRKDWLERLGLDIPETSEELYSVLKAFSQLPSNVTVTKEPVIPAHLMADGGIGPVACSFLSTISDPALFSASSNDIYGVMLTSDPGYEEYLRFLNRLYNEGLLDRSFLVSGRSDAALKEGVLSGRIGVFEAPWNYQISKAYGSLLDKLREADPLADIVSVPPLKSIYDNERHNLSMGNAGNYIFIPLSCSNPETAATYLNWLASEDGGGKLFEMSNGSEWIRKSLFILDNDGYYPTDDEFTDALAKEYTGNAEYLAGNITNALTGTAERSSYYTYTSAFFGSSIRSACKRNTVNVITAQSEDVDRILADYLDELTALGAYGIIAEQMNNNN